MQNNLFAHRLKQSMKDKNLKQIDIMRAAEEKGVKLGKSHISQYVSGKTVPRKEILQFLADVLEVDADWLLGKVADEELGEVQNAKDIQNVKKVQDKEKAKKTEKAGDSMREFKKSTKLDNVYYTYMQSTSCEMPG